MKSDAHLAEFLAARKRARNTSIVNLARATVAGVVACAIGLQVVFYIEALPVNHSVHLQEGLQSLVSYVVTGFSAFVASALAFLTVDGVLGGKTARNTLHGIKDLVGLAFR